MISYPWHMEQTEVRFKIYVPHYYQLYGWAGWDAIISYFGLLEKFLISIRALRALMKFPISLGKPP